MQTREAILLINMGGPDSTDQVQPYLREIFRDPAILPLPGGLRQIVAGIIASRRSEKVEDRYKLIGGCSLLRKWTEAQARELSLLFQEGDSTPKVAYAFRYASPFIGEAMAELKRSGIERVTAVPLFPHYTFSMTGSVVREVERAAKEHKLEWSAINAFGNRDQTLSLWRSYLHRSLDLAGEGARVLFVAHGIPVRNVQKGDPYPEQVLQTAEELAKSLPEGCSWSLSYQSKVGPVAWTEPHIENEISRLAASGAPLVIMPLSFVSDCLETLYDLDIMALKQAQAAGIEKIVRVRVFNDDPRFAAALHSLIAEEEHVCSG